MSTTIKLDQISFGGSCPEDLGASPLGVIDARQYFVDADATGEGILVTKGTYSIQSNLTLSSSITFQEGAIIKPANGVVVTFEGEIFAGNQQIFDYSANGEVVIESGTKVILSSWFAATQDQVSLDNAMESLQANTEGGVYQEMRIMGSVLTSATWETNGGPVINFEHGRIIVDGDHVGIKFSRLYKARTFNVMVKCSNAQNCVEVRNTVSPYTNHVVVCHNRFTTLSGTFQVSGATNASGTVHGIFFEQNNSDANLNWTDCDLDVGNVPTGQGVRVENTSGLASDCNAMSIRLKKCRTCLQGMGLYSGIGNEYVVRTDAITGAGLVTGTDGGGGSPTRSDILHYDDGSNGSPASLAGGSGTIRGRFSGGPDLSGDGSAWTVLSNGEFVAEGNGNYIATKFVNALANASNESVQVRFSNAQGDGLTFSLNGADAATLLAPLGSLTVRSDGGDVVLQPKSGSGFLVGNNLPTANPGGSNRIWNNSGVLNIT